MGEMDKEIRDDGLVYFKNGEIVSGRFVLGLGGIRGRHGFQKLETKKCERV